MSSSSYTRLPPAAPGFAWTVQSAGPVLRCGPLGEIAPHAFTTRHANVSSGEQRQALASLVDAREIAMVTQVHGCATTVVRDADGARMPNGDGAAAAVQADVLVSDALATAIAVRVADCVPLLMADRARGVVAAVHAGWRGTAARAAVAAVDELQRQFGTRPSDLVAAIGPSIGLCCYEVGTELVDAFAVAGHERHLIDRWFVSTPPPRGGSGRSPLRLDLALANRDQLVMAGVPDDSIFLSGLCTAMHLDLFTSFRAEREKAGRMLGVIRARGADQGAVR